MALKISLIIGLLTIFYQDMRYRAVYWLIFPFLLVVLVILSLEKNTYSDLIFHSSLNVGFLIAQFLFLTAYFSLKKRSWVNITSGYLGWGDILFLISVAFYLSPGNYLVFYISSLMIVLLVSLLKMSISKEEESKIPLAGLQALLFALLVITDWMLESFTITNDSWILTYLHV